MNHHGGDLYQYDRPMVDFSANINPLGVPDSFKKALGERWDVFARYPDPSYQELKQKVAAYLKVDPQWVLLGNGAVDLIYKAIRSAARERVYGLCPTFSEYRRAASVAQLDYRELPVFKDDYRRIDLEKLCASILPGSTVVLCNPNNPTGTLVPQPELGRVVEQLARRDCALIVDEAFIEFTDGHEQQTALAMVDRYPQLLVIRAATKFFGMPGLRLGYGITANPNWQRRIRELDQPWQINAAAVVAAEVIFNDREYLSKTKVWLKEEPSYLYQSLGKLPDLQVYPSQANFYLARLLRADFDAYQLHAQLVEQGVLIRTPQGFSGLTPYHFRVAVKDRASNDRLVAALRAALTAKGHE